MISGLRKVALALSVSMMAAAGTANAATIFAVDGLNNLVSFNSAAPGTYLSSVRITGFSDSVQALDFRPANGALYALAGNRTIYTINTATGVATSLGAGPLAIEGTLFGFDFNPVADAIRIVSNTNQNYRVNPNTGALIAQDTNVFYPNNTGQDPDVIANAYVSGGTTQYAIDSAASTLVRQNNNAGDLTTIGSLGVTVGGRTSFDIAGSDAFVQSGRNLYSANLQTGALTRIGQTQDELFGLAISVPAVPEPATWAMMIVGFAMVGAASRYRRRGTTATFA
ncbi:hypothetical protein GGQ80_002894 [Sphingomonas jinjuensis]|uniref:DUF4394 domain-containing protein n=1 Tax=Sphingomonas jinjuensis TaxID=535907 RepID=A0A840FM22_9SPHN|nr:DUF4394 domain-containing protein [Sphingomonas jinjuensis]MBB4154978.1 hypothetical protein [Sphingomonas jinjuensis]